MSDLINFFPTMLLGVMVLLTLILLPLLNDDRPVRDDRQRTDRIQVPTRGDQHGPRR
ncbi:MAG: hypothetical protein AB4911_00520 [Oscillochloridaceae bacterium umkhey_bin13]